MSTPAIKCPHCHKPIAVDISAMIDSLLEPVAGIPAYKHIQVMYPELWQKLVDAVEASRENKQLRKKVD